MKLDWPSSLLVRSVGIRLLKLSNVTPVLEAYPDARLMHVVRDGRAVALSLESQFAHTEPTRERALEAAARYWVDVLRTLGQVERQVELCVLKYEDLCEDVHGTVAAALAFTGLGVDSFPIERLPATLESTNRAWFARADPQLLRRIEAIEREPLANFGYGNQA